MVPEDLLKQMGEQQQQQLQQQLSLQPFQQKQQEAEQQQFMLCLLTSENWKPQVGRYCHSLWRSPFQNGARK